MQHNLKPDMTRVARLMSAITPRQITAARFRLAMTPQDALDHLAAAYRVEVERRHGTFIPDDNTVANLAELAVFLTLPDPKFGIMCCGTCGNGKTTLLYAFQRLVNYLEPRHHFDFLNDGPYRYNAAIKIFSAKEILSIARDNTKFQELKSRSMLAIDDLGAEAAETLDYGRILTPVIDLIEYRYNMQLFTFITTNLVGKEVRAKYGARIADRFNEMLHVITFQNITYRR